MFQYYLGLLKEQFNNRITFYQKREGIYQLIAPFYHEDGDMIEIFLQQSPVDDKKIRISDFGLTLMRLSYSYQIDTENKQKIFQNIISENELTEENGTIYIDVYPNLLYAGVVQFAQTIAKVSSMRYFSREVVRSLFYEMVEDFVMQELRQYRPIQKVTPIAARDDLEVDYMLQTFKKPIYLFAVKDVPKARLATICCLEFQKADLPFKSVIVHENFESLPKKDQSRITSAADKQFISLDDFKERGLQYLEREAS